MTIISGILLLFLLIVDDSIRKDKLADEYSVIGDKGKIGFGDFEDDISVCNFDANTEGPAVITHPSRFVQGKP